MIVRVFAREQGCGCIESRMLLYASSLRYNYQHQFSFLPPITTHGCSFIYLRVILMAWSYMKQMQFSAAPRKDSEDRESSHPLHKLRMYHPDLERKKDSHDTLCLIQWAISRVEAEQVVVDTSRSSLRVLLISSESLEAMTHQASTHHVRIIKGDVKLAASSPSGSVLFEMLCGQSCCISA